MCHESVKKKVFIRNINLKAFLKSRCAFKTESTLQNLTWLSNFRT